MNANPEFYAEARRRLATLGLRFERYDWIDQSWDLPYLPSDFAQRYPFFQLVPTEYYANLDFRERLLRLAANDERAQRDLWIMCKRDFLFFVNAFLYIEEPRNQDGSVKLPWITPPAQQAFFWRLDSIWGKEGLAIEKSREQAASWGVGARTVKDLCFGNDAKILFASQKQDAVDELQNADTLFAKIRFMLKYLPGWMKPPDLMDKTLHITSPERNNYLDGSSTNEDLGRGGRRKVAFVDESAFLPDGTSVDAALASVTDCRIDASTPKGAAGSFYARVRPGSKIKKISLHWAFNAMHNQGIYYDEKGRPRSPWYDKKCQQLNNHPVIIAQELDLSYTASDYGYFIDEKLRMLQFKHALKPHLKGRLEYEVVRSKEHKITDVKNIKFVPDPDGPLDVWGMMTAQGRPVPGPYGAGCDISMGTGASNSAMCVKNKITHEKVAQLVTSRLTPPDFACYCAALGRWFGGHGGECMIGFERNGPGAMFGTVLEQLGYGAIDFERKEDEIGRGVKKKLGWWSDKNSKRKLFDMYAQALYDGRFIERSEHAYSEHRMYVVRDNQAVVHVGAENEDDPTGAGDNHGDIVIANAVCEMVMQSVSEYMPEVDDGQPKDTWEWRNLEFDRSNRREKITIY